MQTRKPGLPLGYWKALREAGRCPLRLKHDAYQPAADGLKSTDRRSKRCLRAWLDEVLPKHKIYNWTVASACIRRA